MYQQQTLTHINRRLQDQLYRYLLDEQLDLLIALEEDHRLEYYLLQKVASVTEMIESLLVQNRPDYVIEALGLEELTCDLRPSRFAYLCGLLEEDFETDYRRMKDSNILAYEIINLIGACEPIFLIYGFGSAAEDSRELRLAVTGMIAEYLEPGRY